MGGTYSITVMPMILSDTFSSFFSIILTNHQVCNCYSQIIFQKQSNYYKNKWHNLFKNWPGKVCGMQSLSQILDQIHKKWMKFQNIVTVALKIDTS